MRLFWKNRRPGAFEGAGAQTLARAMLAFFFSRKGIPLGARAIVDAGLQAAETLKLD
jgi:hypothetical protein